MVYVLKELPEAGRATAFEKRLSHRLGGEWRIEHSTGGDLLSGFQKLVFIGPEGRYPYHVPLRDLAETESIDDYMWELVNTFDPTAQGKVNA